MIGLGRGAKGAADPSPEGRAIIMLKGYLDASGENYEEPVVVVAGFVGTANLWDEFGRQWKAMLDDFELARFHAAPFASRKGRPFSEWCDKKHQACFERICKIFDELKPFGVGTALSIPLFEEWRIEQHVFYPADPYFFCIDRCLFTLIHGGIVESKGDEGIEIYCDRDKGRERISLELASWHEAKMRKFPTPMVNPERHISTHYVASFEHRPLQAADILAHGAYQVYRDYGKEPSSAEPSFIEALKKSCPISVTAYRERAMFEQEGADDAGGARHREAAPGAAPDAVAPDARGRSRPDQRAVPRRRGVREHSARRRHLAAQGQLGNRTPEDLVSWHTVIGAALILSGAFMIWGNRLLDWMFRH